MIARHHFFRSGFTPDFSPILSFVFWLFKDFLTTNFQGRSKSGLGRQTTFFILVVVKKQRCQKRHLLSFRWINNAPMMLELFCFVFGLFLPRFSNVIFAWILPRRFFFEGSVKHIKAF